MSVVATLVVSQDGASSKNHSSKGVSSSEDRKIFLERRRAVDCIIIGGNTARHEPYHRTPVPLVVVSRSSVNPVAGNQLAQLWNCSPAQAVEQARITFGDNILIEGGISFINELIDHNLIDRLELSVTPANGGENIVDWQSLLQRFAATRKRQESETIFYSATR